jgi:hypothetical protein
VAAMASIEFGEGHRLELEQVSDWLEMVPAVAGAQLQLRLRAVYAVEPPTPARTYRIAATVDVSRFAQHNRRRLCRLEDAYTVTPTIRGAEIRLSGHVSTEQLRVVDEIRAGADAFWMNLTFDVSNVAGDPPMPVSRTGDLSVAVRATTWGEQTQRIEAASFIDVLVPVPHGAEMVEAVARLRAARQLLLDGQIDPALDAARKALEPVRKSLAMRAAFKAGTAKTDPHQRLLDERFALMVEDVFSVLSGCAHDDPVTKDFEYTREDALALIAVTAGLVKRHIAALA